MYPLCTGHFSTFLRLHSIRSRLECWGAFKLSCIFHTLQVNNVLETISGCGGAVRVCGEGPSSRFERFILTVHLFRTHFLRQEAKRSNKQDPRGVLGVFACACESQFSMLVFGESSSTWGVQESSFSQNSEVFLSSSQALPRKTRFGVLCKYPEDATRVGSCLA